VREGRTWLGLRWVILLAAAALAGCGGQGKVVVFGVCGLPPQFVDQLVAQGKAPNFARLYREGAVGRLMNQAASVPPLVTHIWTSYATGVLPDQHRVLGFANPLANRLIDSTDRRAPAIWEIASAMEKRVGTVNWPASYPAEAVRGFVISDRYLESMRKPLAGALKVSWERDDAKVVFPKDLGPVLDKLALRPGKPVNHAAAAAKADQATLTLAFTAFARQPVDLLMIFTDSFDQLGHLYWHTHEPLPGEHPARDAVVTYAELLDGVLGDLLSRLRRADHLVVLSDHGLERGPIGGLPGQHVSPETATGLLLMHGPRIREGIRLADANLLDVLPTLLELLRVPASVDMPGKIVSAAFRDDAQEFLPRRPAYARAAPP
jgi:predicted AlkP superfamily phosphohydrolase/phosphomutase